MKKIIIVFIVAFLSVASVDAQSCTTQLTIKPGSCPSCVGIYFKPDFTDAALKFSNVALTVSVANSASPAPSATVTTNNLSQMPFTLDATSNDALGGRTYYDFSASNSNILATVPMVVTSGTEFLAFEIAFSNGTGTSQIQINDLTNGNGTNIPPSGISGLSNIYISIVGPGCDMTGRITPVGSGFFYADPSVSSTGTANGDQFVTTTTSIPLPLGITAFTAQKINDTQALLNWDVELETLNLGYEIAHSSNGVDYAHVIAEVQANGAGHYKAIDPQPKEGTNFYRLKVMAKDGKVTYATRTLSFAGKDKIVVAPTITNNNVHISLPERFQNAKFEVINYLGQAVHAEIAGTGDKRIVSLNGLAAGTYLMRITNDGETETFKIQLTN